MARNWVTHTLERTGWQPRNQVAGLILLGVLITLIFSGIYLSQVASYAATNREIESLIAERNQLELSNEGIRAQIAELQTVPRLLERAQQLGFRPAGANDIEYLVVAGYNPQRAQTVIPLAAEEEFQEQPQYDQTFSGWIEQQWDTLRSQFEQFGK